jgi:hypothetical protein
MHRMGVYERKMGVDNQVRLFCLGTELPAHALKVYTRPELL